MMLKSWEICVLVYDYLNKNGYNKTTLCFNKECPTLHLTDPPPVVFTNVIEKLLLDGDLADRLNKLKTEINEKVEELQKEVSHIRKRLKRRRHVHSDEKRNSKQSRLYPNSANFSTPFQMQDTSYHNIPSANLTPSSHLPGLCSTPNNTGSASNFNQFVNSQTFTSMNSKLSTESVMKTPEKRNLSSSSKRKKATPKKLTSSVQGSFIQTLADNINAKNEEAALDTLNSAEPWLEQFISSISEPAAIDTNLDSNEEAALSTLLSLNQSGGGRIQTPPPLSLSDTSNLLSSVVDRSILDSTSQEQGNNKPLSTAVSQPMSLEPIVIQNKNTISALKNNKNAEVIVLPSSFGQYTKILPKPAPISELVAVPVSYYMGEQTTAPVYNFTKTTPQQKAKSFFNQLERPYHQQLSRLDQLYLVDTTVRNETTPKKISENPTPTQSSSQAGSSSHPNNQKAPKTVCQTSSKPKESFTAWDQKMRQAIAENSFKEPSPVEKKKKKKRSKDRGEGSKDGDPKTRSEKKKKRRKHIKNGTGESSKKSGKKKKRRVDKDEEPSKKPPITPEFISDSNDSDDGNDTSEPSLNPRVRHVSESDSMMCDSLLKSLNDNSSAPNVPCDPQPLPTPTRGTNDPIKPAFIEENANSSFDINKDSRPKPVVIPEGSQNSCSCHSSHNYRELTNVRCVGGKTFSFNEGQDHADSPRNYNESSSITVSSLFPQLSDSSRSFSPRAKIRDNVEYRGRHTDEQESDNEQEEGESEGEEVREQTSKLPPLPSQDRDLLESSDDEQDVSGLSAVETSPHVATPHRPSLSESDLDSPKKSSPIKKARLKISAAKKVEDAPVKQDIAASEVEEITKVCEKEAVIEEKEAEESTAGQARIVSEEEVELPVISVMEVVETVEIGSEPDPDFNDSQDLIIDGDDTNTTPSKPLERKNVLLNKRSGRASRENNKNSVNAIVEESSCEAWYQSIPNKMENVSFICQVCKKYFPSIAVLNVHTETCSMSLVCDNCGRRCGSKTGLTLHRKSCVKDTDPQSSNVSKGRRNSHPNRTRVQPSKPVAVPERKSSGSSKIRTSPRKQLNTKKSLKKKKKERGEKMHDEEIDEFLGKLRYE